MAAAAQSTDFSQVGQSFRLGMEAQGCAQLMTLIDRLLGRMPELAAEQTIHLQFLLEQALAAQQRKDFLLVADILEYEVAPLFHPPPVVREDE